MINCAISMLPIFWGSPVVAVLLAQKPYHPEQWEVRAPPLHGEWKGHEVRNYRACDQDIIQMWEEGLSRDIVPDSSLTLPADCYEGYPPENAPVGTKLLFSRIFEGRVNVHRLGEEVKDQILAVRVAIVHRDIWLRLLDMEPENYIGEVMPVNKRAATLRRLLRSKRVKEAAEFLECAGIVSMPLPQMNGLAAHVLRAAERSRAYWHVRPPQERARRAALVQGTAEVIHLTQVLRGLCRGWQPSIWEGPGDHINKAAQSQYLEIVNSFHRGQK